MKKQRVLAKQCISVTGAAKGNMLIRPKIVQFKKKITLWPRNEVHSENGDLSAFFKKIFHWINFHGTVHIKKLFIKLTCQATLQSTSLEILYWILKHKVWMDQPS